MRKNFRRIPAEILQEIEIINGDFIVGAVIDVTENDFSNPFYSCFGFSLENGNFIFNQEFVPPFFNGHYSKKNIDGYRVKFPDRPKVLKRYYVGERPIWGDYFKGTFSLFITKSVIAFEDIPPKEISLNVELLDTRIVNEEVHYILKISANNILNNAIDNFEEELFFVLNLLQENVGNAQIYRSNTTREEYLNDLYIDWEIFPPGERDRDIERITRDMRNPSPERLAEISDRYDFLREQEPINFIHGKSGMLRYEGAKFSDDLVVFENVRYGNALYILFENWEELSKLSRLEIQNRPPDQYIRIPHKGNWKEKVRNIIKSRRTNREEQ